YSNGAISNSYNLGTITVTGSAGGITASGNNNITNSFWNKDTSGIATSNASNASSSFSGNAGYRWMTTAEMMAQANFTNSARGFVTGGGWTFNASNWGIVDGTSLPYLRSIYTATPRAISGIASGLPGSSINLAINGMNVNSSGLTRGTTN